MTTSQLECFIKVAETLNFKNAANQLFISQPAVSKQILSLENELDTKLFIRSSHYVLLTQEGKAFLDNARNILKLTYQSKQIIASHKTSQSDTLRIGYSEPHEMTRLTYSLCTMRKKYPQFYPVFTMDSLDMNLTKLEHGDLDVCFTFLNFVKPYENLMFVPVTSQKMICLLPASHPKAKKRAISFEELKMESQIITVPFPLRSRYHSGHEEPSFPTAEGQRIIICSNATEAYALVRAGYGYCVLPEFAVVPDPAIRFLPWEHATDFVYGMVFSKEKRSSMLKEFVQTVKQKPDYIFA